MKLKNLLTTLVIIITFESCKQDISILKYVQYEYEMENINIYDKMLTSYELQKNTLTYCYDNNQCESYIINQGGRSLYISKLGDTTELVFDKSTTYTINNKEYKIDKYLQGSLKHDGETQHYWSSDFGVILVKSTTWNGLSTFNSKKHGEDLSKLKVVLMNDKSIMMSKPNIIEDDVFQEIDSLINEDL